MRDIGQKNAQENAIEMERLLTETSLAQRWSVSVRTLQNNRVNGRGIPYVKIGRSVRYRLSDVIAFEAAAFRANTSESAHNG